jgi:hypothetical protein
MVAISRKKIGRRNKFIILMNGDVDTLHVERTQNGW